MTVKFKVASRTEECKNCGFCDLICTHQDNCTGCGACVVACPYEAKFLEEISERRKEVIIKVNHEKYSVPERITVLRALELTGFKVLTFKEEGEPSENEILAPCRTGGCWSCEVIINGELKPSCVTPVEEGMAIITDREEIEKREPKRIVSSFQGHAVGGVGTPYWLKPRGISCGFITNGRLLNIL